jgi:hypothetical protein
MRVRLTHYTTVEKRKISPGEALFIQLHSGVGEMNGEMNEDLDGNLKDVDVYVLGADPAGQEVAQWVRVREFWIAYFNKVQANLKSYSLVREVPNLGS